MPSVKSKKQNLIVLVSGGRSSARMAFHIHNSKEYTKKYNIVYVFCNTGMERPETIDFLKKIVDLWDIPLVLIEGVYSMRNGVGVRHRVVDFDSLNMDGRVFSEAIKQLNKNKWTGVPNEAIPYCSEYLKTRVSHSFAKEIFGTTNYVKAIGYRAEDMPKRITYAELKHDNNRIAPLITDFSRPVNKMDLSYFFEEQPFRLEIQSDLGNCELCWKKSTPNLIKSIQFGTRFIDWHREHEQEYGNMFFRENMGIDHLVKLSRNQQLNLEFEFEDDNKCVCNF